MFRDLWRLLSPFHRTFGWFAALLVIYEGLQIVEGYTISFVVRLFGSGAQTLIWVLLVAGLIIFDELFMRLDNQIDWHIVTRHSYPIYNYLKTSAMAKFLEMDIPWHLRHNSGTLVGKVSDGVWKIIGLTDMLSWEFVPTVIQTLLSLVPILILSPHTAAVALVGFVIFSFLALKAHQEKKGLREARQDFYEEEWRRSVEIVQSVETSLMFGQNTRLYQEQQELHNQIVGLGRQEARIGIYKYNRWQIRILTVVRRGVLAIWIWQLSTGTMDIAGLIFVSTLTEKLFHSFWKVGRLADKVSESSEAVKRLTQLVGQKSQISKGGIAPQVIPPIGISLENVCFSYSREYDSDNGALHDFSLEIEPGQIVALVGPSGAGKTTLRRIVTKLFPIQGGTIKVGGLDINQWNDEALLTMFSYVPQGDEVAVYDTTIKENIAFPKPGAPGDEVIQAADLAGIHDFILSLPDGYDTLVGERGKKLSGGQKQRVALARAILADCPILILDEATSSVDAITEREIQTKMRAILAGKTAIIIAHRLSTIWDLADKIAVLDNGRKAEEGTHKELVRMGGLYAKMVELQTSEFVPT